MMFQPKKYYFNKSKSKQKHYEHCKKYGNDIIIFRYIGALRTIMYQNHSYCFFERKKDRYSNRQTTCCSRRLQTFLFMIRCTALLLERNNCIHI